MKIMFSDAVFLEKPENKLNKEEIITLINVYNKLSESIALYEKYLKMEKDALETDHNYNEIKDDL